LKQQSFCENGDGEDLPVMPIRRCAAPRFGPLP
jgi:hypothetical protein